MLDFVMATPDDREQVLGREFRNVYVFAFGVQGGSCRTDCLLQGKPVTLIGDPVEALRTFLGGGAQSMEVQQ